MSKNRPDDPGFTLENFSNFHGQIGNVEVRSELAIPPYVDADLISVDITRIFKIGSLGRLSRIGFSSFSDNHESISVGVSGLNSDGSATANRSVSAKKVKRVKVTDEDNKISEFNNVKNRPTLGVPRRGAEISINLAHPDIESSSTGVRDPNVWAKLIDQSIREGLRESSTSQLLGRNKFERIYRSLPVTVFFAISTPITIKGEYKELLAAYLYYLFGNSTVSMSFDYGSGIKPTDREWLFVPGIPVERALAVQYLTRSKKIAKII